MRLALTAFLLVLTALAAAPEASASCGEYDKMDPCKTRNGHYRIVLPEGRGPFPTVLYLYGPGFVRAFTSRGYALIVPAGVDLKYATGIGSGWFLRNSRAPSKRDDIRFVEEVLEDAALRHRIDRKRVLIAGMSNGGFLTWEIACHAPHLGSAYAPVAAGYLGEMPERCERPGRILHTHGRADEIVTIDESGDRVSGGARIMLLDDTLKRMARSNRCVTPGAPRGFQDYTRTTWQGCPRGASVDLLMHDGGHTIPNSWYNIVLDWFEGPGAVSPAVGGGTARFQKV